MKNTNQNFYYSNKTCGKIIRDRIDIASQDYKRKTCLLTDISIPTDNNISVKDYNRIIRARNENWKIMAPENYHRVSPGYDQESDR